LSTYFLEFSKSNPKTLSNSNKGETKVEEQKISFWKRIIISIKNIEQYQILAGESTKSSLNISSATSCSIKVLKLLTALLNFIVIAPATC